MASGGRPSRGTPSPLPWLLFLGLSLGGFEVHSAIASLLLREDECISRGPSSELIQLINVLEEVAENDLPVELTTADICRAFNVPERTAQ
jgi:hypothetical protein